MRVPPTPAYDAFASTVLNAISDFTRTLEDSRLADAIAAIAALPTQVAEVPADTAVITTILGWFAASPGARLSRKRLEKENPGYTVSVTRTSMRILGRRARWLRWSFRITATGTAELAPFSLRVPFEGSLRVLPGSNTDATAQIDGILGWNAGARSLRAGYVDHVHSFPQPRDDRPSLWLATLANAHPAAIRELVSSPGGRAFAQAASDALNLYPVNARWADKVAISVYGTAFTPRSDLELLTIERPNPNVSAPESGLPAPSLTRDADLVVSSPSSTFLPAPSERWLSYTNALLQDGGTVTSGGSLIVYEDSADPVRDLVAGQWTTVFGSPVRSDAALVERKPSSATRVPEGILLSGRNDFNWFHWMIEYLPRALVVPDALGNDVPLLVSNRVPSTGMQALSSLTSRPVLVLDADEATPVGRLHVLAPPVQILDSTRVAWRDGLSVNPEPLQRMRAALGIHGFREPTRDVFLARRSAHRSVANEPQLAEIASRLGLELVDPLSLDFADQVELFATSRLIVGASGAVMANYAFMREGSSILALTSEPLSDFVLPAALASVAGARFAYLTGPPILRGGETREETTHADFVIDPAVFERALTSQLSER